jgi:hypothetical protein
MTYSKQELIKEMKRVSREYCNGNAPTHQEMDKHGKMSGGAFTYKFNSWNKALEEAGFNHNLKHRNKKEIKKEIIRISEEYFNGNSFTRREFDEFSEFTSGTVRRQIDGWNEALEKCGLEPIVEKNIENHRLVEEIKRVSEEYCDGEAPTTDDIIQHGKFAMDCYHRRSWNKMLKQAGFTPFEHPTGEEHWAWKGGCNFEYGSNWREARETVRKRDKNICLVCGNDDLINEYPDVHHIVPTRYWKDSEYEKMNHPRNLICLCRSCHADLEGKFKGRNYEEFKQLARDYLDMDEEAIGQPPVNDSSVFDY